MRKYPLTAVLSLRRMRRERAELETMRALAKEREAFSRVGAAERELADYRVWRPDEEQRLFGLLRDRLVPVAELDRHRDDVKTLRDREAALADAVEAAVKEAALASEEVLLARRRQAEAVKSGEKIEMHRKRWQALETSRLEKREEAELEDFAVGRPGLDSDDDDFEEDNP